MITRFRTGVLTKQYTVMGFLANGLYLALVFLFLGETVVYNRQNNAFNHQYYASYIGAFMLIAGVLLVLTVRRLIVWLRFRRRPQRMAAYAARLGFDYFPAEDSVETVPFHTISLTDIHNVRDVKFTNIIKGPDWDYADFSYNLYRRTKRGDYHSATVYYGVMSMALPRELPNIFFDSKLARGRQFRFEFNSSQCVKLEGNFDRYFMTYFPPQYNIDGLSIITPDVMLALEDARDYDIEIQGNRVFLYGPLFNIERQLPDMVSKLQAIKKELLDNILTYRDDRLPYQVGRQRVTPLGASLQRSKLWTYASIALAIIYFVFLMSGNFHR